MESWFDSESLRDCSEDDSGRPEDRGRFVVIPTPIALRRHDFQKTQIIYEGGISTHADSREMNDTHQSLLRRQVARTSVLATAGLRPLRATENPVDQEGSHHARGNRAAEQERRTENQAHGTFATGNERRKSAAQIN